MQFPNKKDQIRKQPHKCNCCRNKDNKFRRQLEHKSSVNKEKCHYRSDEFVKKNSNDTISKSWNSILNRNLPCIIYYFLLALFVTCNVDYVQSSDSRNNLRFNAHIESSRLPTSTEIEAYCYDPGIRDIDYFVLAQFWPTTNCMVEWDGCQFQKVRPYFTIHGLWPTLNRTIDGYRWPQCCNTTMINMEDVHRKHAADFEIFWVDLLSIRGTKKEFDFWSHEWFKHGSCSKKFQEEYFAETFSLRKELDLMNILAKYNITSSDTQKYRSNQLEHAILQEMDAKPRIVCKNILGKEFLSEIYMCLDTTLKTYIDCPEESNCGKQFIFPESFGVYKLRDSHIESRRISIEIIQ